jgi:ribonuclease P protein component
MLNTLPKNERKASLSETERLFSQGDKFMAYPFSVRFITLEEETCSVSVLLTSPKRYQKTAVNRNRAKRLLRETYRKNKQIIHQAIEKQNKRLVASISLVSKQLPTYQQTEKRMLEILNTIAEKISHEND